jgi:DNA-directed RNA polymerase subunit omega
MARVTIEDCLQKVNNRFMLVHLGAKRVIQLRKGAKNLVEAPKNKEVVLALREIAAGAVGFDSIAQLDPEQLPVKAEEESTKSSEDVAVEEAKDETAGESVAEAQASDEVESESGAGDEQN